MCYPAATPIIFLPRPFGGCRLNWVWSPSMGCASTFSCRDVTWCWRDLKSLNVEAKKERTAQRPGNYEQLYNGDALCMGWPSPRSPSRALQSLGLHLDLHVSIFGGYVDCELRWNQTHEHQAKEPHLMSKRKHFTLHSSQTHPYCRCPGNNPISPTF